MILRRPSASIMAALGATMARAARRVGHSHGRRIRFRWAIKVKTQAHPEARADLLLARASLRLTWWRAECGRGRGCRCCCCCRVHKSKWELSERAAGREQWRWPRRTTRSDEDIILSVALRACRFRLTSASRVVRPAARSAARGPAPELTASQPGRQVGAGGCGARAKRP